MKSNEEVLHDNVTAGGGIWLGIQTSIPPEPDRVIFRSMITQRTISLFIDKCTLSDVQYAIVNDVKPWYRESLPIKRKNLFGIKNKLEQLILEIDNMIEEKE